MPDSDGLEPDFNFGVGVTFGGGQPIQGTASAQVGSAGTCTTCNKARVIGSLGLPLILVGIAVVVLAFRR